jgi:hypothetical protein
MEYQSVLTTVAEQFTQSPIEFTVEFDVQARLTEILRDRLRDDGMLYPEFANDQIEYTGHTQNYKESYVDHLLSKVGDTQKSFSRVHTEVAPYSNLIEDLEHRERIDIVVFSDQIEHPIRWKGGSQKQHWDDYDAAIEVKYIKNKAKFPADINDTEITDTPIEELQGTLDFEENSIGPDIEELERLPDSTESYLMIISNHDYLYRGPIPDLDENKQVRYSRLSDAVINEMQERAEDTQILYAHPTGWQWIKGNTIHKPQKPKPGDTA